MNGWGKYWFEMQVLPISLTRHSNWIPPSTPRGLSTAQLSNSLKQKLLLEPSNHLVGGLSGLRSVKRNGRSSLVLRESLSIAQIGSHKGSEFSLDYDQKVGMTNGGTTLAGYLVSLRNVYDVDEGINQLRGESRR